MAQTRVRRATSCVVTTEAEDPPAKRYQEDIAMTTSRIAASETRLRPALVATLVAITFVVGIGAGFALSQVVAVHPVAAGSVSALPKSGADMSSAAYAAQHPTAIGALSEAGTDMSSAAYAAQHRTAPADMSAAAYAATHDH